MTASLFDGLGLKEVNADLFRNIRSIRQAQDLFDDLSDAASDQAIAVTTELAARPPQFTAPPIIRRPFEHADYVNAILFPFKSSFASRYSDGTFGVWYGADTLETSIHETVYHWRRFLSDAGLDVYPEEIRGERRVYRVRCVAALLDLRPRLAEFPALIDPSDYAQTQAVGRRIHREGHPGLLTRSARCTGETYAIFRPEVLSDPRDCCYLSYRLAPFGGEVRVERQAGKALIRIPRG